MTVSDEHLEALINGLTAYKKDGVVDPWVLSDGTIIEPLDILKELRVWREYCGTYNPRKRTEPEELQADTSQPPFRPAIHSKQPKGKGVAD